MIRVHCTLTQRKYITNMHKDTLLDTPRDQLGTSRDLPVDSDRHNGHRWISQSFNGHAIYVWISTTCIFESSCSLNCKRWQKLVLSSKKLASRSIFFSTDTLHNKVKKWTVPPHWKKIIHSSHLSSFLWQKTDKFVYSSHQWKTLWPW